MLHTLIFEFADSSTEYQNEARHQELENLFFGLKDGSLDDITDQDMADSINDIGTLVLGGDMNAKSKEDIYNKRYMIYDSLLKFHAQNYAYNVYHINLLFSIK